MFWHRANFHFNANGGQDGGGWELDASSGAATLGCIFRCGYLVQAGEVMGESIPFCSRVRKAMF